MADKLPEISLTEFREKGYLLEANRRFFHPIGLALFIRYDADTEQPVGMGVFDFRNDPEGCVFGGLTESEIEASDLCTREWNDRTITRSHRLGFMVQPIR